MNRVRDLLYLLFGYLSGCVLYAEVFSRVFHKEIASAAKDKNPGAANAFVHGGFWCGVLTLAGDMLKGMVPVALYMRSGCMPDYAGNAPVNLARVHTRREGATE